jgi:hypothetical protein
MILGDEPDSDGSANLLKACLIYGEIGLFIVFVSALFTGPV